MFELPRPKRHQTITKVSKQHRNPIIFAQEWQEALAEGKYTALSEGLEGGLTR